jgi:hypothetical protein
MVAPDAADAGSTEEVGDGKEKGGRQVFDGADATLMQMFVSRGHTTAVMARSRDWPATHTRMTLLSRSPAASDARPRHLPATARHASVWRPSVPRPSRSADASFPFPVDHSDPDVLCAGRASPCGYEHDRSVAPGVTSHRAFACRPAHVPRRRIRLAVTLGTGRTSHTTLVSRITSAALSLRDPPVAEKPRDHTLRQRGGVVGHTFATRFSGR